ncbi:uncharacterized protein Cyp12e1 [Eurosta solidaginis]|uniref:uncharacterized protein Cyp12e1 n=1 Tax=Eurosta solidaginis TaxID=178769 RepID=UPI003530ADD0
MLSKHTRKLKQSDKFIWRHLSICFNIQARTYAVQAEPKSKATADVKLENARPYSEVPGPSKFDIVRMFLPGGEFSKKPFFTAMTDMEKQYGNIFRFPGMFGKQDILIDLNPDDYPTICRNEGIWPERRNFDTFVYHREKQRPEVFEGFEGITSTSGEKWGKMRSAVNPILMQPKNARLYLNTLLDINKEFLERVRHIRDPTTNEVPDDFYDDLNRLAFEGITGIALNTRLGLIHKNRDSAEAKTIMKAIRNFFILSEELEIKPSIWKYVKTPKFYEMMRTLDTLTDICNKYIGEALARIAHDSEGKLTSEVGKEKSVLEKLVRIDRKFAVVMALDMMIAGIDTTSSTLAGLLLCLATNADKQEKLFEEIVKILPHKDSQLTIDSLQNLPYLRACIKEGIRYYPILPGTVRRLNCDVVLSGYSIPAGTDILIGANLLMRDERYVPKSDKYIPERWLRNDQSAQGLEGQISNPFMYVPFGFGPRSCVGKRIVNMELEITLAYLVRNFKIEFNYPTDNAFAMKFMSVPQIPLKFKFTERDHFPIKFLKCTNKMLSRYRMQCDVFVGRVLSGAMTSLRGYAVAVPQAQEAPTSATTLENARPYSELPGPSKYEIVRGFMPGGIFYKAPFIQAMNILTEKYGSMYRFPSLFGKPEMVVNMNPADYPIIFRNEGIWPQRRAFETFIYHRSVHRSDFFRGIHGLITTAGEDWAKIRTAVNPVLMQPKNARLYLNTLLEINEEFLERIRDIRDPKTLEMPDDFHDDLNRLSLEGVVGIALNTRLGLIHKNRNTPECKKLLQSIRNFFDYSEELEVKPSIWKIIKTPTFYKLMDSLDTLTDMCNQYIDEAIKKIDMDNDGKFTTAVGKEKSVLEKLLRIDRKIAVVMALDMMMAGVDTTSSTLTGILFAIAKNPDKQAILLEELKRIMPTKDSKLNTENMNNLPYLRACIKEGMRYYPIIAGTMRRLPTDVVLSGYRIPAGTDISISSNLLLRNENFIVEPNKFIPERWLRKDAENKKFQLDNPFVFLPFGFGPRICVGKRIVDLELEVTLARLVRNFDIEFNYSTENAFKPKLVFVPAIPLNFKFEERKE